MTHNEYQAELIRLLDKRSNAHEARGDYQELHLLTRAINKHVYTAVVS